MIDEICNKKDMDLTDIEREEAILVEILNLTLIIDY